MKRRLTKSRRARCPEPILLPFSHFAESGASNEQVAAPDSAAEELVDPFPVILRIADARPDVSESPDSPLRPGA